jgi:hypothetical protein
MITIHSAYIQSTPLHCHPNGKIEAQAVVCHAPDLAVTMQDVRIFNPSGASFFKFETLSVNMARTIAEHLNKLADEADNAHRKLVEINKG